MTTHSDWRDATRVVHSGRTTDSQTGAVTPPIHLSTTFARADDAEPIGDYVYSRYQNPNREALERCLADLERGAAAAAFASGSAAANAILQSLEPGTVVYHASDLYHGVRSLMQSVSTRAGLECSALDCFDLDAVTAVIDRADVIWCETPSNPQLGIVDVTGLSALCRDAGVQLIVDNTFATPILQRPLALGADLVVHATTKYLAGHGDVTGGVVVAREENPFWERVVEVQRHAGAVPSPFDCWLTLRGIATLAVRVAQHVVNATEFASRLHAHPAVEAVLYPGLPDHPQRDLAEAQMSGPGGVVSMRVVGGEDAAAGFVSRLRWIPRATSLGGVHTLAEHRVLVEPDDSPVPRDLVRFSVGIEDIEDIWADVARALG